MVVRTRLASILLPLAFHCLSGAVGGFFVWHAFHGERGIAADLEYRRQMADVETQLKKVRAEKAEWQKRINLLRGPEIDRDLLDEEARNLLNRLNKADLLVILPPPRAESATPRHVD
jgi:cell division protein FtsB